MRLAVEVTETENLFETLANKSPVGLCIIQDGKFCYTNPTFQHNTGYREDELLGRDALELVVPEDRERVRENAVRMLKGELTSPDQFRVIHKDGSIHWVVKSVSSVQYHGRRATMGNFVDITEYKEVEEKLRESEEKYRTIFENVSEVIIRVDRYGKIVDINGRAEECFGYKPEEVIGKNFAKTGVFSLKEMPKIVKLFGETIRGKHAPIVIELEAKRKDGSPVLIEVNSKLVKKNGKAEGFAAIVRDITERKQAEEALQAEKNKLQSLIDAMEDTITIQDTEYNIIYQNEPSRIASGGDHLGEKCYRAYEGREKVCDGCPVEKAFEDGKSHTAERKTAIEGKVAFWENTANPIRDAEGRTVSCLELARDITERKKQEQALADELTRRRLLVDQSLDGIVVLDVDARVVEANPRFAEMLGYTLEEVHKLHTWDWDKNFPPEQILEMGQNVDEKGLHLETKHTRKDGSVIDVDISINGTMCGGQKLIFSVCRDITERKQVEEKVQHLNRVLRAIRNVNQLIARGTDRDSLLKGACDTFVKTRGYYSAWIALLDSSGKLVTAAEAGLGKSFLQVMERLKRGELTHCGCKVLEKPGVLVMKDVSSECEDCPLAKKYAGRDAMSVRLEYGAKVYGLMTVSIPFDRAAEKEEQNMFEEIAGDIGFALHSIEQEQERKQAEEELKEAEKEKSALLEEAPVGMMHTDLTGKITYINKRFESESGYSREEIVGKNGFRLDWLPSGTMKYLTKRMTARLRGKPAKSWEAQFKCKDGRWIWVEIEGKVLRKSGVPVGFQIIARNMTERKRAEETLQESEERYRALFDRSLDCIFVHDFEGNFLDANEAALNLLGYQREDIPHLNFASLLSQDQLSKALTTVQGFKETGVRKQVSELRLRCKDGSFVDVEVTGAVIYHEGKPYAVQGVGRDITERKQAEETLQAEKNKLQSLVDALEYGLTIQDKDYNIIYQNTLVRRIFGDRLGEKCYRVYEGRDKLCDGCPVKKAFEDGESHTSVRRVTMPSGEVAFWENTANPIRDAGGRIVSCLEVTRDITERKRMEEALRDSEEKLRKMFESVTDGISVIDLKGSITKVNQRTVEMHGFSSKDELRGKSAFELVAPRDHEKIAADMKKAIKKGAIRGVEYTLLRADGSEFPGELSTNVLKDASNNPVGHITIARDITERKKAEEVLQTEKNKLESIIYALEDAITILDRDYNILYQSKPSTMTDGYHLGEKCYRVFEGKDKVCDGCPVAKAFGDGKSHTSERRIVMLSGEVRFIENTANPIRDAKGNVVSCVEVSRNITERKQAEEVLKRIEEERSAILNSMTELMVYQDTEHRISFANKAAAESVALSIEQLVGRRCYEIWHQSNKPCAGCPIAKARETGKPQEAEMTTPDGRVWFVRGYPVQDADGNLTGVVEVTLDITERKKQEQALADELTRRRLLFDQSVDGIVVIDENDKVYEANKRFAEMLGYTPEEIRELHTWDWDKNYSHEQIHEMGRKADEKGFLLETTHTRKDGSVFNVDISINASTFGGQKLIFCVCRDVTERKKQEQALADELTRRRLLIDQSLDGIVVLDSNAKVVEANQSFAEMLGYTLEEVRELHTWDWERNFPPEKILEMGQNVDEKGLHLETRHTRKDGSVLDVDISISAAMVGGQKLIFCVCRDITERKQAEEELKLRAQILDSATDAIFVHDNDDNFIYVNEAACRIHGYTREEFSKMKLPQLVDPERSRPLASDRQILLKKGHLVVESAHLRKDGSLMPLEVHARTLGSGKRKLFLTVARDITERKQAKEALQAEKNKLQSVIDAMEDALTIQDRDYNILYQSKPSGITGGYHLGEKCYRAYEGKDKVCDGCPVEKAFKDGKSHISERSMVALSGKVIFLENTASPIRDAEGKIVSCLEVTRDITKHKQAEEAIKQAAEEWKETFDSISDAISIHDRDYKILRANKAFADVFHKKPSQILGRYCYELHKGSKPISGCPHKRTLSTGKPAAVEFYEAHLGKHLQETTSPIFNGEGEVVGTVHIIRDITEQKQQNERLMMADRLASIGELAAGTAHELNNPLTSVIGFSQLVMEKDIPDDIREDLQLIYSEAQRAANVTKNLLTFGRKHAPVKQPNQINNIIEDVLKLRAYEHKVNGIEVKRQLAPDLSEIMVDYFQMQQVFLNIIINAEYFMTEAHKRGTLTITTKKQNSTVRISIADDGPGIPRENLSRIFNPFFTTKEAGKGTGLGLSICHGIVSEHGGQIYARSQPGKGTTIVIELPTDHVRGTP